ncbi:MAG: hypothetical protein KatS3mg114_0271 [Planctomycetaceae bacterium]|nr:MAG: hypothetical protein KatS3mg114_0271 [Planctomycetaceae bacterium]
MPSWNIVFGSPLLSRRSWLQAGSLSLLGGSWLQAAPRTSPIDHQGWGRARQCVILFMWGGPSHLDTFDPKPSAPPEIRGPFSAIETNVPGIHISEHFTQMARRMDRVALIRSLTHDDPAHLSSVHTLLTGHLPPVNKSDAVPPSDRDTPHLGCVMAHLRPSDSPLPRFVTMPWIVSHPAAPGGKAPGQHGGWLGRQYDPFLVTGDPNADGWQVPALALQPGQTQTRLATRRSLLVQLDQARRSLSQRLPRQVADQQQQAFDVLTAPIVREAFDIHWESPETRERYGRNIHGQCVLLARRLLDYEVPVVAVNWHDDHQNFWDTHGNNFNRLKNDLIPPSDRALAALLDDLQASGRLDHTIVLWVGEFGRSPHINGSAGREHHPFCYCGLLAGAGIRGGQVYGRSDPQGAFPADNPVSPSDLTATLYHALGVAADTTLHDNLQRPHRIINGTPLTTLFG